MDRLLDRRIIVTGAGSGIGAAVVQRFLGEGASVVAVDRNLSDFGIPIGHPKLRTVEGDLVDYETNVKARNLAVEEFGGLDVFVANAGRWDFFKRLDAMTRDELDEGFESLMGINVKAVLMGAHCASENLKETRGVFIATGSNAAFRAGGGGVLYTATKFAVRGIVAQLAVELAPGVRVVGVAPGATDTPISGTKSLGQSEFRMNADSRRMTRMASHIPLKRVSAPEEHTDLYVLLASKSEAPYVTGTILISDGGLCAGQ